MGAVAAILYMAKNPNMYVDCAVLDSGFANLKDYLLPIFD